MRKFFVLQNNRFFFFIILQGMIWNSMGPISNSLLAVFCPDWNKQTLALFGNWGNIMYLIPLFPVLWFLETKGLRKAMVFTGFLMFLGVVVRCLPLSTYAFTWYDINPETYRTGYPIWIRKILKSYCDFVFDVKT